jgi:hypothetical protein
MRTAHLSDNRLVELYFTETLSAQEQQHLGACHACDSRRTQISHLLDETAQASIEDVETAFPAERLARQQLQILDRVDAVAGPARVIAFPAHPVASTPVTGRTRPTNRWVAAAAVAGLVVGVVAGRAGRSIGPSTPRGTSPVQVARQVTPAPKGIRAVSTQLSDDEFLVELESALGNQNTGALRALDELTPRVGER